MKVLIKKARVIDETSKHHNKQVDILILNSKIEDIKSTINPISGVRVIQGDNLHCSPSWLDLGTQIGEPGLEQREDIESVVMAAKAGGYGAIASFPNTLPSVDTKAAIKFILEKSKENKFTIYPIASLSELNEGKEITEMMDLTTAGAIAFSDGLKPVMHTGLMARALEYVKQFNGLIIHHPYDKTLSPDAQMHEGEISTMLGMRGAPYASEILALKRDLELLQYCKSKLCSYGISSAESVKLIKEAKKNQLNISATVPYLNLIKTDSDLIQFDSNLKVQPPLRRKSDITELIKGLKEDTIDAIVSNHYPIEIEGKKLEYPFAKFGASGIETVFSALNTYASNLDLNTLIKKISIGPRNILGIEIPSIQVGEKSSLTIFDPTAEWRFEKTFSKSSNNPFLGQTLKGKVIEVIN